MPSPAAERLHGGRLAHIIPSHHWAGGGGYGGDGSLGSEKRHALTRFDPSRRRRASLLVGFSSFSLLPTLFPQGEDLKLRPADDDEPHGAKLGRCYPSRLGCKPPQGLTKWIVSGSKVGK